MLREGRIKRLGKAKSGGKGEKRRKAGWKEVDSPWGVGWVCTGGVKNFSPFVSV